MGANVMRIFLGLGVAFCLVTPAISGEFTDIGDAGGRYTFTGCTKPQPPELRSDPTLKGRKAQQAINLNFSRYNGYVDAVNAYLNCISLEADRDLKAFNQAVNTTFEASQNDVIGTVENMRGELGLAEAPQADDEKDLEQSLDGGADVSTSPPTSGDTARPQVGDDAPPAVPQSGETFEVDAPLSTDKTDAPTKTSDLTMAPIGR